MLELAALTLIAQLQIPLCVPPERLYRLCDQQNNCWHECVTVNNNGTLSRGNGKTSNPPGNDPNDPNDPDNPNQGLGNPGNSKNVGKAGEKEGKGFGSPSEGGLGTKGRSDGKSKDKRDKSKGKRDKSKGKSDKSKDKSDKSKGK